MKLYNVVRKYGPKIAAPVALTLPLFAHAAGPDFSSLTGAVDFSTVGTAILAIAALMVAPLVIKKGARFVMSMIGR